MSILEKLFIGEYRPWETGSPNTKEYKELLHCLSEKSMALQNALTDEQNELLSEYQELTNQCDFLLRKKLYEDAVRLGAGIVLELAYPDMKPSSLSIDE